MPSWLARQSEHPSTDIDRQPDDAGLGDAGLLVQRVDAGYRLPVQCPQQCYCTQDGVNDWSFGLAGGLANVNHQPRHCTKYMPASLSVW